MSIFYGGAAVRNSRQVTNYAQLRALTGPETEVYVTGYMVGPTPSACAGSFLRDDADATSDDNGGTVLVRADGVRFKRVINGDVNVKWFLTQAQEADVNAYTFSINVQGPVQTAIDWGHKHRHHIHAPAGGYLVNSLVLPGLVDGAGIDERSESCRFYGIGYGEAFVIAPTGGTAFKSNANAPVLTDILGTAQSSNGTWHVDNMRFDGNTSDAVVKFASFYGQSSFHHCVIYQRGTGDGFVTGWGATVNVHSNYALNAGWIVAGLGNARTGHGFRYAPTADNGLVTFYKCTSRGFLWGYRMGGAAGAAYSPSVDECECSYVTNGVWLEGTAKAKVTRSYFEGADGGIGIKNDGDYSTISDNLIFPGFLVLIDDSNPAKKGTNIEANTLSLGAVEGAIGIDMVSSAAFGGYNKNAPRNSFTHTPGTAGQAGIRLRGTQPRVDLTGNSFDPRGEWTGAGTSKIRDESTDGIFGPVMMELDDYEAVRHSAVMLSLYGQTLGDSAAAGSVLTVPHGNDFEIDFSAPRSINQIASTANTQNGVVDVTFEALSANVTFASSGLLKLDNAASFVGPGTITLRLRKVGSTVYATEKARAKF